MEKLFGLSGSQTRRSSQNKDHKWFCIKEQITPYKSDFEQASDQILFFLSGPSEGPSQWKPNTSTSLFYIASEILQIWKLLNQKD